ncbi:MAG TPA: hypothetical protein DCY94_05175 [Firmicutes bacterium]|nr:hypothetical protein [Bacillota bacterium]
MLYLAVYDGKFDDIKTYLDAITEQTSSDFHRLHDNFCLYLFSFLIDLPEPYRTTAKNLKPKDYVQPNMKMKILASKQFWGDALTEKDKFDCTSIESLFIDLLLKKVASFQFAIIHKIFHYIDKEKFDRALLIINQEKQAHPLDDNLERLRIVLEDILFMERNNISSTIFASNTDSIELLLQCRNYNRARELLISNKIPVNKENVVGKKLLALIEYAIALKKSLIYRELFLQPDIENPFKKMQQSFEDGNINLACFYLIKHLKQKGLEEYYYLMENYIKICNERGYFCAYLGVLDELTPGYIVPVRHYIESLEIALRYQNFFEARLFLNIIEGAYSHNHSDIGSEELASILEDFRRKLASGEAQNCDQSFTIQPIN